MLMSMKLGRVEKNLTQEELSKRTGVSRNTLSRLENSDKDNIGYTSYSTLKKIADELDLTVTELVEGNDE